MATTTGTHVNFVKVPTMAKFDDITTKADGTIYFIVDAKKIYLDGVMYGFNDSDIDLSPYLQLSGGKMTGTLDMNGKRLDKATNIRFASVTNGSQYSDIIGGLSTVTVGVVDNSDVYEPVKKKYELDTEFFKVPSVRITGVSAATGNTDAVNLGQLNQLVVNKIGTAGGIATLDTGGKVPSEQLPSYVDDVLEYSKKESFPSTGETGKLYIDLSNNRVYRWSGSAYVNVSDGNAHLTLGTSASTAYRGDHGLDAYIHSKVTSGNPHRVTKSDVGLGSVLDYGITNKADAEAGTSDISYMTPLRTAQAIAVLAPRLAWEVVE